MPRIGEVPRQEVSQVRGKRRPAPSGVRDREVSDRFTARRVRIARCLLEAAAAGIAQIVGVKRERDVRILVAVVRVMRLLERNLVVFHAILISAPARGWQAHCGEIP